MRTVIAITLGWMFTSVAAAIEPPNNTAASAPAAGEIVIREALVIGKVGVWKRTPTHTDAVEAQLVAGTWSPPSAGQTLELPDGQTRTWERVQASPDGKLEHDSLGGGYAYAAIESPRTQSVPISPFGTSKPSSSQTLAS